PVTFPGRFMRPSFDSRKQSFYTWTIAMDYVIWESCRVFKSPSIWLQFRHKFFRAGKNKDVRFISILIFRQSLVGFPRDCRERQIPPQSERPIAGARVIGEGELRPKTRTTWRDSNGHGHRTGTGHRIGREFLTYTPNRAAAFGQRDGGGGEGRRTVALVALI